MSVLHSRAARHQRIVVSLGRSRVRSQGQLADLLADDGFQVTQATVSRDLDELGAVKVRAEDGRLCYAVPGEGGDLTPRPAPAGSVELERLRRRCETLLVSVDSSANIVILRTPPGGAQFLASAIDHSTLPTVIGTVAGDDTVLLVTRDPNGARDVAADLMALATAAADENPRQPDRAAPTEHRPPRPQQGEAP